MAAAYKAGREAGPEPGAIEPELGARVLHGVNPRKCCRVVPRGGNAIVLIPLLFLLVLMPLLFLLVLMFVDTNKCLYAVFYFEDEGEKINGHVTHVGLGPRTSTYFYYYGRFVMGSIMNV